MSAPDRLAVVIECRDDADAMELTLDDLYLQGDDAWEAVVVDNGSLDEGTRARVHALRWPRTRSIRLEPGSRRGVAGAACEATRGELVLLLRAGDRLASGAIAALRSALAADAEADLAWSARPAAGADGSRPTLARRLALAAVLESHDPVAAALGAGAKAVEVGEGLLWRPSQLRAAEASRNVRARSLITTNSEPPAGAAPNGSSAGHAALAPAGLALPLELGEAVRRLDALSSALREARHEIASLRASASWRLTAPLRLAHRWLTRGGR